MSTQYDDDDIETDSCEYDDDVGIREDDDESYDEEDDEYDDVPDLIPQRRETPHLDQLKNIILQQQDELKVLRGSAMRRKHNESED